MTKLVIKKLEGPYIPNSNASISVVNKYINVFCDYCCSFQKFPADGAVKTILAAFIYIYRWKHFLHDFYINILTTFHMFLM